MNKVAILVESYRGIPLVRSAGFWRLPETIGVESPERLASQELEKQFGRLFSPEEINDSVIIHREWQEGSFTLFWITARKLTPEEGLRTEFFSIAKLETMKDFLPDHRKLLQQTGILYSR